MKIPFRLHISYFIGVICFGILVGVCAGNVISAGWVILLPAAVCIVVSLIFRRFMLIILALIGGIGFGVWRGSDYEAGLQMYENHYEMTVSVSGIISDDVTEKSGSLSFVLHKVTINKKAYVGDVYVTIAGAKELLRGQRVVLSGELSPGFGAYAASLYRATVLSAQVSTDVGVKIRNWFYGRVRSVIDAPAADLGMGFLTGQKSALPVDLSDALQVAGLTHIVVASGYNLTILVRFARRFFMRISKFFSAFGSLSLVFGFVIVAGMGPSLERAAIVTVLSLAAWYYGRRFNPIILLVLVASVTVLVKPSFIWGDLGWLLSFLAFFGVMIIAPLLQKFFYGEKKSGIVRQILGETIAAHSMTAPVLILTFGLVSHVAILANLLVLPLVPLAMLLTFLAGIFSTSLLGSVLGQLTEWLLGYMISVVHFFAGLSWAQSEIHVPTLVIIFVYVLIIGVVILLVKITKHDIRDVNIID